VTFVVELTFYQYKVKSHAIFFFFFSQIFHNIACTNMNTSTFGYIHK